VLGRAALAKGVRELPRGFLRLEVLPGGGSWSELSRTGRDYLTQTPAGTAERGRRRPVA